MDTSPLGRLLIFTESEYDVSMLTYLRQWRIADYSVFDSVLTLVALVFLAPWLSRLCRRVGWIVPLRAWYFFALPVSLLAHVLTGRFTPLTLQFLDPSGHIFVKVFMIALLALGFVGVKKTSA